MPPVAQASQLAERVVEETDKGARRTDLLGQRALMDLRNDGSGLSSFPKWADLAPTLRTSDRSHRRTFPHVGLPSIGWIELEWTVKIRWLTRLLKKTAAKWWDDNALRLSAALSYYTLFSLAPLLTIAVAVAGFVVDKTLVQDEVLGQLQGLLGKPGSDAVANMLESAGQPVQGTIATVISLVTLIIVSMGMFSELQDSLNLIWRIPSKGTVALWRMIKDRFLSFILVIGTGFLLLVSLLMSAFLAALGRLLLQAVPGPQGILAFMDIAISLPAIVLLFALMFKVLPDGYIAWRDVWLGAVTSGTLFMIGKWAIGLYLGSTAMASMYGAASSLMVVLVWVYYSALIFFLGAEFTAVYAHEYGSRAAHLRGSPSVS
ncbi:MAG: YihY/virulence factor BrkB family protein [Nitrospiraceae bacterium]